jgi:hypothetical protein
MSNRKELSRIADTFSEERDKRTISDQADFTTFGLGFETDDIQMSYYKKDKSQGDYAYQQRRVR